jgi:hypothetical protein
VSAEVSAIEKRWEAEILHRAFLILFRNPECISAYMVNWVKKTFSKECHSKESSFQGNFS